MEQNKKIKNNKKINNLDDITKSVTITDDKMINEILGNMGKGTKNKSKTLINNFLQEKKKYDNTITTKTTKTTKKIENNKEENNKEDNNKEDNNKEDNQNNNEHKKTFTENLTKDDINQKLEDYKLVEDISKVPLDTHLRYFIKKNGEMLFRMGGNLKRNLDLTNYIVLKNAQGIKWTVQVKDTIFYKKMTIKEIKDEYEGIINELHDKIKKLKIRIKELEK